MILEIEMIAILILFAALITWGALAAAPGAVITLG
jgi:hypothetical protein